MDSKLEEVLEGFKDLKIAVIGDAMIDLSNECRVRGVIKENPSTPLEDLQILNSWKCLGGAANVANNVVSLGMSCDLYGVIGCDIASDELKCLSVQKGINQEFVYEEGRLTPVKERFLVSGNDGRWRQSGARLTRNEQNLKGIGEGTSETLYRDIGLSIKKYGALIFSDYNKGIARSDGAGPDLIKRIISLCNSKNVPVIVDAKPCNIDHFQGCTVICPNRKEIHEMSGERYSDPENLEKACEEVEKRLGPNPPKYIVVTCDRDGAFIYDNGRHKMVETRARYAEDVTGAGDSFTVGLATMLGIGRDIYDSVDFGNLLAGIAVEEPGTTAVTKGMVKDYLSQVNLKNPA